MADTNRNWTVVDLEPAEEAFLVVIEIDGERRVTGHTPSEFGEWGLSYKERAIVRRGLTPAKRDRKPSSSAAAGR